MVSLMMHVHRCFAPDSTERTRDGLGRRDPGTFPVWVDAEGFEDLGGVEVGNEGGGEGGVGAAEKNERGGKKGG